MLRRAISIGLTATLALVAVPTVLESNAHALNPDLVTLDGTGDFILGTQHISTSAFTVSGTKAEVVVAIPLPSDPTRGFSARLNPPPGETLKAGFYEDAERFPSVITGAPGLEMAGDGRGCSNVTGRFVIDEITYHPDETVASLVAHWEQHCEGTAPAGFGTVSWNGSTPLSPVDAVAPTYFKAVAIDTTSAVKAQVVTNSTGSAVTVTSVQLGGTDAAQFQIVDDTCTGSSVPDGASCTVGLVFAPTQLGISLAALTVLDGVTPVGTPIALRGAAVTRVAHVWFEGESDDYVIGPNHLSLPIASVGRLGPADSIVVAAGGGHSLQVWFGSTDLAPLTVGVYNAAGRFAAATPGHPRFDVFGDGRGCNMLTARFVVDEFSSRADGMINRFVAHWESHCENGTSASFGGVNYNGTIPFVERAIAPLSKDFGTVAVGMTSAQAITVSNIGPSPLHVTSVVLAGASAGQFGVVANSCVGVEVPAGAACTVTVRFSPTAPGTFGVRLSILDDAAPAAGAGTGEDVVLRGTATTQPFVYLEGEDDDSMVGGPQIRLANTHVTGTRSALTISGSEGSDVWAIRLAPKAGTLFAGAPVLLATKQFGTQDATHGGLGISWNNLTCQSATGRISIEALTFKPDGTVQSLVARWEYHCRGEAASSFGGVRFNSPTAFAVPMLTDSTSWEQVIVGTTTDPRHLVLSNDGGGPLAIGAVALTGTDASQFQVVADECSNRQIASGSACVVDVRFHPTSSVLGEKVARLVVPHTGALLGKGGSGQDVSLRGSTTVPADSNFGELTLVSPARLLDTSTGVGAPRAPLGAARWLTLQVTGRGGVPTTGVGSVVVNVTTRRSTSGSSFVTVWPAYTSRPPATTLIPVPGLSVSNLTTVRLGTGGRLHVYNQAGSTEVAVDVVGWYSDSKGPNGARFHALKPARIVNTAQGIGGVPTGPVAAGGTLRVDIRSKGGVPSSGVSAVALNVTAVRSTAAGALTVFAGDRARPSVAALAFTTGSTTANMVVTRVPASGIIQIHNSAGRTNVTVDVLGYWTLAANGNAGRFVPVAPARAFDTGKLGGPQSSGSIYAYQIGGRNGVAHDAGSAVLNVTAVRPSATGFLRVYADDVCAPPATWTVPFTAGRSTANGAFSLLSLPRPCAIMRAAIDVYNSAGNTNVLIDVAGYFTP